MLSELFTDRRDEIIARCRARLVAYAAGGVLPAELGHGVPWFLHDLERAHAADLGGGALIRLGAVHGSALLLLGFTAAHVVRGYVDVCQTVAELAREHGAPLGASDVRSLERCLDALIVDVVDVRGHAENPAAVAEGTRRSTALLGVFARELHDLLGAASLAFNTLRSGEVGIGGSTGDLLARNLVKLRDLVDRSLTVVRLSDDAVRREHIALPQFLEDVEVSAVLSTYARNLRITVADVDPRLSVESDRQILSSIVSNLLQNALRYTRPHSHVWVRTFAAADRVRFEIEDQCGGIPVDQASQLIAPRPAHRGGGLEPGLSICIRGAEALRGAIHVRNQNRGCVFTLDVPRRWDDEAAC